MENRRLDCKFVLKVYKGPGETDIYAEYARVLDTDKGKITGPFKPLSHNAMFKIASFNEVGEEKSENMLFDERLLFEGMINGVNHIIWWEKRGIKRIYLNNEKPVECRVPAMLFMIRNRNDFFAYALKEASRPTKMTKLYHPPFYNTYLRKSFETSNICLGNVKTMEGMTKNTNKFIDEYSKYWWKSEFSDLTDQLIESVRKGVFPYKKLLPTKFTVGSIFTNR